jgi:hypothetical protein
LNVLENKFKTDNSFDIKNALQHGLTCDFNICPFFSLQNSELFQ